MGTDKSAKLALPTIPEELPFDFLDFALVVQDMGGGPISKDRHVELAEKMRVAARAAWLTRERMKKRATESKARIENNSRGRKGDLAYDRAFALEQEGKSRKEAFEWFLQDQGMKPDKYNREAYRVAMNRRRSGRNRTK